MKFSRLLILTCACAAFLFFNPVGLGADPSLEADGKALWFIPIQGDIQPSMAIFVQRHSNRAIENGAEYIVYEIDTYGGLVDSAFQIASYLISIKDKIKTIAWINNNSENSKGASFSAGALIALSCGEIIMAEGTSIGAAAPVAVGVTGETSPTDEKTVSAVRSKIMAYAKANDYPAGLALAMVDADIQLVKYEAGGRWNTATITEYEQLKKANPQIGDAVIICDRGKLLTLDYQEALEYGLISHIASYDNELFLAIGFDWKNGRVEIVSQSIADSIISILNSGAIQSLLILIALVLIFLEIQSPGFGIPGAVAIIAFLAVLIPNAMLGRIESLEIILFLTGIVLLAVEIFLLPGFGVVGIAGILLIGGSLILSMQEFAIPTFDWQWEILGRNALVVFIGLILGIMGIAIIMLFGPKLRMFNFLVLDTKITGTAGGPDPDHAPEENEAITGSAEEDEESYAALLGKRGTSETVLRPSGRAIIDGKIYYVESAAEFIEEGRGILVTRVRGNRIVVRKA